MHIKQVIIRGFKTYKDQVSLAEDFHQGVNVVVGFNGSGKSNFFNAILFVISDYFGTLRPETRKALLHEGTGPAVLTAFVEIAFDNRDRRMPIDKDDVRIRRTIAAKKDDYTLDGKHATKAEIFSLLESCGFTKSNPYYIVQQGKIAELTLMNDSRRLELIKEVSGASVYDDRKSESLKILEEIRGRRAKADEVIATIQHRIGNLEEEQRELVEFNRLERERRCLEFELTDRDWRTAQDRIDGIELERRGVAVRLAEAQRGAAELRARLGRADVEVQELLSQRQALTLRREEGERSRAARRDELARARLELEDESRKKKAEEDAQAQLQKDLEDVRRMIDAAERDIEAMRAGPELARRQDISVERQRVEAHRDQLLAKQGRGTQHRSIEERNAALADEVARQENRKEKARRHREDLQKRMREEERGQKAAQEGVLKQQRAKRQLEQDVRERCGAGLEKVTQQLETCAEERRLLMQKREQLVRRKTEAERQVAQFRANIDASMPRPQRNALSEVRTWAAKEGLQSKILGTLLQVIEVPEDYRIAADIAAGGNLFNLLVKDDDIAAKIISLVRVNSYGSIVCTPLNRIVARPRTYPQIRGTQPLVDVIKAPEWARPAVRQVFGRFLVCSSLELCDEVSRKHGLDAVTLDGDKVNSHGAMTGGYQDPSRFVRLGHAAKVRQGEEALAQDILPAFAKVDAEAQEKSGQLEELHGERRRLQDERGEQQAKLTRAAEELQDVEAQLARHEAAFKRSRERLEEAARLEAACDEAIRSMQVEMQSESLGRLTAAERGELDKLTRRGRDLEAEAASVEEACRTLERELRAKEQHLGEFLRKRLRELEAEALKDISSTSAERERERRKAVERLEAEVKAVSAEVDAARAQADQVAAQLEVRRKEHEKLTGKEQELQANISKESACLDELAMKVNTLAKKKHEADEKMRNLTVVPADIEKYKQKKNGELLKDLGRITKDLQKFEHVNKKAIDQFATFKQQLEDLERSQKQHDESMVSIESFIRSFDEQKDETLLRTMGQVDEHFRSVFGDLVRGGVARLRMVATTDDGDGDSQGGGGGAEGGASMTRARGVQIEVSFPGQSTTLMSQLSGGQKTVVAIALIFAIQRLEPAPFYLFDEIDAALDMQYRTTVARLIKQEAAAAQMVITTFRPEIIDVADRFYRVYQKNRVSRVECVSRQEAGQVIEEQNRLERPDGG